LKRRANEDAGVNLQPARKLSCAVDAYWIANWNTTEDSQGNKEQTPVSNLAKDSGSRSFGIALKLLHAETRSWVPCVGHVPSH